jgi:NADH dehydrogenase
LYEKNKNQFNKIHSQLPHLLSKLAKEKKIDQFIHVSALGVENAIDSEYAKSKFDGENSVKKNFKNSVILKPSIVYSIDDNFTTSFMTLLNRLPIMPLYYNGDTKFFPIHVSDLTEIIFQTIVNEIKSETIECIGPEELSFKEIIKKLLKAIDKKRLLIPVPLPIAKISAFLLGLLPKPLLTSDQLRLLKYNNVPSNKYKTNFDLGFKANKKFEIEIEKYSYNWRSGGEYTRNKDLKLS